jgi:hypothetical protein
MAHFAKRRIEDASSVHGQKFGRFMKWALSHTVTFTIIFLFSFFHTLCQSHGSTLIRFMAENPGQFTAILWSI